MHAVNQRDREANWGYRCARTCYKEAVEIELKWGLTHPQDLVRLLAALPEPRRIIVQQNHYFTDTDGQLHEARTMVRIREEAQGGAGCATVEDVLLTVKRRTRVAEGVFEAEETEEPLDGALWRDVLFERKTLDDLESPALRGLRDSGFAGKWVPEGVLTNKRHVIDLEGFVLEVDRTLFDDGHVDVEVEVETDNIDGARSLLERIGTEHGIDFYVQQSGKYSRFLKRLPRI